MDVFDRIIKDKSPDKSIRIWVPGCSTGEEAYSIAIALLEFLEGRKLPPPPIQIFGSDIHEKSIEKARQAIYPETISTDVSPERLRRYFRKTEEGYQVNRLVREMCVFARHDVTKDPPFARLDLISCRNVLIYLNGALQQKVIPMFHWALSSTGFLLLGGSETVGPYGDLFELIDKKHKIYAKKAIHARFPVEFGPPAEFPERAPRARAAPTEALTTREFDLQREADRLVLERHTPAGVVVDDNLDIIQFRGHTSPYLEPAPGKASLNLLDMARPQIKIDLRQAIHQARKTDSTVTKEKLAIQYDSDFREINIEVTPITAPTGVHYYLVLFQETGTSEATAQKEAGEKARTPTTHEQREIARLKKELEETKEYLQSMIEERDVTNEELRAANEELQSSTEELQSINEELETAKEELQSSNEELVTVNEELQARNFELTQANNDLINLLSSINLPVVMLGNDLRIRRMTPLAEKVLNVRPADVGRPLTDIKLKIDVPNVEHLVTKVIETVVPSESEVQASDGHWYSMQIRPYLTLEKKIEGAVMSLVDIDMIKRNHLAREDTKEIAEAIVFAVREPFVVLDQDLRVISANKAFYETFQLVPEETHGISIFEIADRTWDIADLRDLLEVVLPHSAEIQDFALEHSFPRIGNRRLLINASRMAGKRGPDMIMLSIRDITEHDHGES